MPKNRTPYAGPFSMFIERWAAGSWSSLNYLKASGMRLGLLVNFGRCGGRTKDSINLDFFRVDRCGPWLKNWFPMDMQTAFGTVVCACLRFHKTPMNIPVVSRLPRFGEATETNVKWGHPARAASICTDPLPAFDPLLF